MRTFTPHASHAPTPNPLNPLCGIQKMNDGFWGLERALFVLVPLFSARTTCAASYEWYAFASCQWDSTGDGSYAVMGTVSDSTWNGVAWANGEGLQYCANSTLYLKQYDRKTSPTGDDNVTFVLSLYGDLLEADTIEAATKVPLCKWDSHEHSGGLAIENPSDFYLGFMIPESKTTDGIVRYGWYHLSIADDFDDVTLLDSGVGLYGESVYVGIGLIPEPSAALLLLFGCAGLLLTRRTLNGEE